ncbi:TlyA family RNA methyltransferase [Candidatus Dependentiae bacterium]|nr:TlyA family RNA methyltransferase [Candidatus Dependentiae bacterium]
MKIRLDQLLQQRYPRYSRQQLQSWIMQGKVTLDGKVLDKPGTQVVPDAVLVCDFHEPKYVSRAGFKLERALEYFNIDVAGLVILDAGISTGGFTDCLLQKDAQKVYGIDVGYGQVSEKIRKDDRIVLMERTNLRHLEAVGELVDLVTLDLSFISIIKVMHAVCAVLKEDGELVTLIKPQFEAKKEQVGRGGIIKDSKIHKEVIKRVTDAVKEYGFELVGVIDSPIEGTTGNKEFLAYFKRV